MCEWKQELFNIKNEVYGKIQYVGTGNIVVSGKLNVQFTPKHKLMFLAAKRPDYRTSYSGSALPFVNAEMAYESTPNQGSVSVDKEGSFIFSIESPNAYYSGLGSVYVKPHVQLILSENDQVVNVHTLKISDGIPFRTLSYPDVPPRCSPLFYGNRDQLPVRTQEQILKDGGYPSCNKMPDNFWGLRPPV
jgi:hypothetical protein